MAVPNEAAATDMTRQEWEENVVVSRTRTERNAIQSSAVLPFTGFPTDQDRKRK